MGRYTGPRTRLARREGVLLPGVSVLKRDYPPGQHGPKGRPRKVSQYGLQLREKQKAKRLYGIMERQFSNTVKQAMGRKGDSAQGLVELLERRLDNIIYRLGWSPTRQGARQMVSHGDILVDGKRVTMPSSLVEVGQTLGLRSAVADRSTWAARSEAIAKHDTPRWLQQVEAKGAAACGKVTAIPELQDGEGVVNPQAIIEFYSK